MSTSRVLWIVVALAACGTDAITPEPAVGTDPTRSPPAFTVGGFKIQLPAMTLAPGREVEPCWILPLELVGPSHLVGGAVVRTGIGMHHGNITTRPKSGEGIRQCPPDFGDASNDVTMGGNVLFGSSTQVSGEEWYRFADGEAYRVLDGFEVVARMHYVNPSDEEITVAPSYEWFTIDESKLVHEIGAFIWMYQNFEIPPLSEKTVTGDCTLPGDHPMHVVSLLPHMHKLGKALGATYTGGSFDGQEFLDSKGYDPDNGVLTFYDPPVDLTDAVGIKFSCTWQNTFDRTIHEGIGDNEMCMVFGYSWPVDKSYTAYAADDNCVMFATPPPGT
jgi:hypothetical protein